MVWCGAPVVCFVVLFYVFCFVFFVLYYVVVYCVVFCCMVCCIVLPFYANRNYIIVPSWPFKFKYYDYLERSMAIRISIFNIMIYNTKPKILTLY